MVGAVAAIVAAAEAAVIQMGLEVVAAAAVVAVGTQFVGAS